MSATGGPAIRLRADRSASGASLASWQDPPYNRWAFLHLDQLLTMAPIRRGVGTPRDLPRAERDLSGVSFQARGECSTVGQMLEQTFTDGFVVLHEGKVI